MSSDRDDGSEAERISCNPALGRRQLIRRLAAVEWEALLGLPLGWTDPDAQGSALDPPIIRRSWLRDNSVLFPVAVRDLVEMLQASRGSGVVPTTPQGHVAFAYSNIQQLCLDRSGYGALTVALDTNVLIDYAQYADIIWGAATTVRPADWAARPAALRDLMTVWCWRDVRFWISDRQLTDARRELGAERRREREQILDAFASDMIERASWGGKHEVPPARSPASVPGLPSGADRDIVEEAIAAGCDVFLTEDSGILACDRLVAERGLRLLRTQDLLTGLLGAGELEETRSLCGAVPDNHGMTHLMRGVRSKEAQRIKALADC